jgi:PAS domain S-box-containing protein
MKNNVVEQHLVAGVGRELEKYKGFIDASDIGAWEYFSETDFLWCNDLYFSMLGLDVNDFDLSGSSNLKAVWVDLVHPDDLEEATARFAAYVKAPVGVHESYFRMKHSDGSWIWIWSRGRLFQGHHDSSGQVFIGTHVDISRHKNAEEAIKQERILLRTLIDTLPDTIYIKDVEGKKLIANKADVASIGAASEQEVLGKTDLELFNNDIGLRGYEDDMRVLRQGETILNREEYFLDSSGKKRWLLTTKMPVQDENGRIIRLLGIGHNITARKQAEEELKKLNEDLYRQSQELSQQTEDLKVLNLRLKRQKEQEVERAIAQGKFEIASEVLHDIGNALVGFGSHVNRIKRAAGQSNLDTIKSLSVFLKGQQSAIAGAIGESKAQALLAVTEGFTESQTDNEAEMHHSVAELQNIISHIQDILNIQRQLVREHTGVHQRKPVDLVKIINECKAMLFASLNKKGIRFETDIKPGDYTIKGDHTKLIQVILNVLKNSIEAIDPEAADKRITVEMHIVGKAIELSIADNGQGFDKATGELLFFKGFTTKPQGTGLGLYNCRVIIESHNGVFDIKSDGPGLGAKAIVKFAA